MDGIRFSNAYIACLSARRLAPEAWRETTERLKIKIFYVFMLYHYF